MIYNVITGPDPANPHRRVVEAKVNELVAFNYFVSEIRRIKNSWWGILGDEDITQIVYHRKGDML